MTALLNDSLDDIFGTPSGEVRTEPTFAPASYKPRSFDEVCSKCRGSGRFIGRNGRALGSCFACKGAEQSAKVLAFIADPKAAAIAYGQETGVCCICNSPLTNKTSIEAGIGPICATNMGW